MRPESGGGVEFVVKGSGYIVGGMGLKKTNKVILLEPAMDTIVALLLFLNVSGEKGSGVPAKAFISIFVRRLERIRRGGGRGRMLRRRNVGAVGARGARGGGRVTRRRRRRGAVMSSSSRDGRPHRRRGRSRKPGVELASGRGGEPRGRLAEMARQAEVSEEVERMGSGRKMELAEERL